MLKNSIDERQEAKTGVINLNDDDPATVKRMLSFIYLQGYGDTDEKPFSSSKEMKDSVPATVSNEGDPTHVDFNELPTTEEVERESKALANDLHLRLLNNISEYAIADKYEIPDLNKLAEVKFSAIISEIWPHKDFPAVIQAVFESTPSNDTGLRGVVTKVCLEHIDEIIKDEAYTSLLRTTEVLAFSLLQSIKASNDEAQVQLLQKSVEIALLEKERSEMNQKFDSWTRKMEFLFARGKAINGCRRCGGRELEFVTLPHATDLRAAMKCQNCREEHPLTYDQP